MIIVTESAAAIKGFIAKTSLNDLAQAFVLRMALTFIMHRGRMSCSQAAASIASETCHRGQITRFLARPRWQRDDFNAPLPGPITFSIWASALETNPKRQRGKKHTFPR
ncbi:MAG: hypothetical protein IT425_04975 [Pirellulales bacterium]|nr:hypothetical protein [Pirellulales bacterium]